MSWRGASQGPAEGPSLAHLKTFQKQGFGRTLSWFCSTLRQLRSLTGGSLGGSGSFLRPRRAWPRPRRPAPPPPLPRHCPTCLSGAAPVSSHRGKVCPATRLGVQQPRPPVTSFPNFLNFHHLRTTTCHHPGRQPLGIPGSRGGRTCYRAPCRQGMDSGPQAA